MKTLIRKNIDPETPMCIEGDVVRVDWVNIGEGICGDYNPNDPGDINLLRFDVYREDHGKWIEVEDASYCTQVAANTKPERLEELITVLYNRYDDVLRSDPYCSVKKLGEELSWIA